MNQNETVVNRIYRDIKKYAPFLCLIGLYIVIMSVAAGKVCPVKIVAGIPCPGCGISRSLWLLCKGNIIGSITIHPMGILMIPGIVLFAYERYGTGSRKKWGQIYCIIWSIACVAIYIIRMILFYPHTEPMVYDSQNLIKWVLTMIQKLNG